MIYPCTQQHCQGTHLVSLHDLKCGRSIAVTTFHSPLGRLRECKPVLLVFRLRLSVCFGLYRSVLSVDKKVFLSKLIQWFGRERRVYDSKYGNGNALVCKIILSLASGNMNTFIH